MRAIKQERYGLWELAVLALLRESPMHPYQMHKLLQFRHKDELLTLKRGSLYHAIHRLERAALIALVRTLRRGKRPESTTYSITAAGKKELVLWLQQMVATPRRESSDFTAALSFLPFLTVDEAAKRLNERSQSLVTEIEGLTSGLKAAGLHVDRIHLIESEYLRAMREAELQWVRSLESELRSQTLTWDLRKILKQSRVLEMRTEAARGRKARVGRMNEHER